MPNHVQCVILGAATHDEDDAEPIEFSKLEEVELCEAVKPIPSVFKSIVSSNPPCRYVDKLTGLVIEDVNGPNDRVNAERVNLTTDEIAALTNAYGAVDWYGWCINNWGTKWGTYRIHVVELEGDGRPVLIRFCCANGVPDSETRAMIDVYLKDEWGIRNCVWSVHDPYNGRASHLTH